MTGFLPNRSDRGPGIGCPTATPTMNMLRLNCTSVRVDPSPSTIAGMAGSVPSIPMAVAIEVSASRNANPRLPGGFKKRVSGRAHDGRAVTSLEHFPTLCVRDGPPSPNPSRKREGGRQGGVGERIPLSPAGRGSG